MWKNVYSLCIFIFLLSSCKSAEDFSDIELQDVADQTPPTFIPFSTTALQMNGSVGTDAGSALMLQNFMGSTGSVSAFAFSFWFKMDVANNALTGTFFNTDISTEFDWFLAWESGTNQLTWENTYANSGPVDTETQTVVVENPRIWNHVVLTYSHDNSGFPTLNRLRFYLNGELKKESIVSGDEYFITIFRQFYIFPDSNPLSASLVDEFSFWLVELTSDDVAQLYNEGIPNDLDRFSPKYTHWYRLGENDTLPSVVTEANEFSLNFTGDVHFSNLTATLPVEDPFAGNTPDDPLNTGTVGDGGGTGGGSDPLGDGSGGYGGELGPGQGGDIFL